MIECGQVFFLPRLENGNDITCPFKLGILWFFMIFEFCASTWCGISKGIAKKKISLFNSFYSMSGKVKHHKKLENVNFEETNNAVSISDPFKAKFCRHIMHTCFNHPCVKREKCSLFISFIQWLSLWGKAQCDY